VRHFNGSLPTLIGQIGGFVGIILGILVGYLLQIF
jgi:hypothetical protein